MKTDLILPEEVRVFMEVFKKNKHAIYMVGGAVRNLLMDKKIDNWDFATSASPEQIQTFFPDSFYHNIYGTVSVKIKDTTFEVTPFRKEGVYEDLRHPKEIGWATTIEEDLSRRDFTINAIAFDGKTLIDPYGGQKDLEEKLIKAVGDAETRFKEDALRLIRAVRIATELGFMIVDKTRDSLINNASLLSRISCERIRDELFKILTSGHPADGILLLKNTGLLRVIIPELHQAFEIPQKSPKRHHVYDVGTHMVMSLKACRSKDPIVRLACLLHDIGKPSAFKKDEATGLITFFNHEVLGGVIIKNIADRLRLSSNDKEKLYLLVRFHQFTVSEEQTDKALRRFIKDIGKENIEDVLLLREADRIGSGATPTSWRLELFKKRLIEVQKEPFKITDLKIDGNDVMKVLSLKPGPQVGTILQKNFDEVVEKKVENKREVLLKRLSK